jgi:hypothetical protein
MTYELTAPIIAISAPLLAHRSPRRAVAIRTLADVGLVVLILRFVTASTAKSPDLTVSALWTHARAIVNQGWLVFSESLFPFYSVPERRLVAAVTVLVLAAGAFLWRSLPEGRDRRMLRHGLAMTGAGCVVAIGGWLVLLPANIAYSPAVTGDGTRVNAVAGFGIVLAIFGLLVVCGVIVSRGLAHSHARAVAIACCLAALIGAGYLHRVGGDVAAWDRAQSIRETVMADLHREVPKLRPGAHLYVTGFNEQPAPNVGSFDFSWDLNAAVQLAYGDRSVSAEPIASAADLHCRPAAMTADAGAGLAPVAPVSYGNDLYLVSVSPDSRRVLGDRADCVRAGGTL